MKENLTSVKKELEERKKQIKSELGQIATKSSQGENNYRVQFPEYGRSEDENADEVATFIDSLSTEKSLKNSLEAIDLALGKISHGTYGLCENCGKKIGKERLVILSTARFCLMCKSKKK